MLLSYGTVKVREKPKYKCNEVEQNVFGSLLSNSAWENVVVVQYFYEGVYRYESYITDDKFFATLLLKLQTWMNNFNALFAINHNNHSEKTFAFVNWRNYNFAF